MLNKIAHFFDFRLKTLNVAILILTTALSLSLLYITFLAIRSFNGMDEATERYITSQRNAAALMDGSDYLTEQAQAFTVTGDPKYMERYFAEAQETKRREKALKAFEDFSADTDAYNYLKEALQRSNELMGLEMRAMKLIAAARSVDVPEALVAYTVPASDTGLSADQAVELARNLVFGKEYSLLKEGIRAEVGRCLDSLVRQTEVQKEQSSAMLQRVMRFQFVLIAVLLIVIFIFMMMTFLLIIHPLHKSALSMTEQKELPEMGVHELRRFATIYNTIFRQNKEHQERLTYAAEHDVLTGLYNRSSFLTHCSSEHRSIGLLLIDVDKFKEINDTYGHAAGDAALQRVASVLVNAFRAEDYVFRLGGDEFAVIMSYAGSSLQGVLTEKIRRCVDLLGKSEEGIPPVSISTGVAFSDRQNPTGDIYKDADAALYRAKEHGRKSIAFYGISDDEGGCVCF